MSTIGRAPKDYNAGAWGRIVGRIDKAINTLAKRLGAGEDATRQLQITQREQRAALTSMLTPEATFEWSEYVDPSTNVVYAQCIVEVTRGWAIISDFEYRSAYGNIGSTDSWLSYKTNSGMQFVVNTNYKGGGYYLYREEIDFIKSGQTFSVELRGKASNDDVWLASSHTFDGNTKPEFLSEPKLVLQWYSSTETWQVRAIGEADDDTASIGFIVSDNVELDQQATTQYGDFVTGVTDLSGSDKRFNVLLGSFTPSTKASQRTLWVLAGAFDGASATTLDGTDNFVRVLSSIEIPVSPTAAGILDAGDINGELLADTAKRASVNLTAQHTSGQESSSVTVSGTIQYDGDTTTYTISSQNISVGTSGALKYIYFDPSVSTNQLQVAVATGSETAKQVATKISGKRIFVGIASGDTVERAFFVFTSDAPVISAPYVYASKLEALTATMGTLEAGNAKIGDNVNGSLDGIYINANNYWYDNGVFSVGNSSNAITFDGTNLDIGPAVTTSYGSSAPLSPSNGDLWYDSTDKVFKRYNSSIPDWQIVGSEVESWRATADRTLINGGQIYTNTITATQIDVSDLFAETITLTGSISSNNYVAATSGWSIGASTAEFNDVTIRGTLTGATGSFSGTVTATNLTATTAGSIANLNISGTLTIGASGGITDSGSNFTIDANGISAAAGTTSPTGGTDPRVISGGNMLMYGFTSTAGGSHDENFLYGDGGTTSNTNLYAEGALIIDANGTGTGGSGDSFTLNFTDDALIQASSGLTEIKIQSDYIRLNGSAGGAAILTTNGNAIWHAGNLPFSLSSVASGDIIYHNGSNWVNLAKGADGQVLTLASGLPSWAAGGGGAGDITAVNTPANSGLDGGSASGSVSLSLDFSNLTAGTLTDLKAGTIAFITTGGNMRNIAASNLLFSADGITTTVKETQIRSIGGGDSDQWRERDLTFTNGILTATGTWSDFEDIVVVF